MQTTLNFDAATASRNAILANVEAAEESRTPGFAELARQFVLSYLGNVPRASGEDLVDAAADAGIVATEPRAWGPIFGALSRDGRIAKDGFCQRRKGHATAGGLLWRLA